MHSLVPDHQTWERRINLIPSKYFRGCPRPQIYFKVKHKNFATRKFPDLRYIMYIRMCNAQQNAMWKLSGILEFNAEYSYSKCFHMIGQQ